MAYIHLYQGNPTAGGTNGTAVSEDNSGSQAVSFTLNATNNEIGAAMKLALRCDAGYQTQSGQNTVVSFIGGTNSKWEVADDNAGSPGTWSSSLTISAQIGATNKIIWVRARATSDETPVNDTSVDIKVDATIEAV